MWEFLKKRHIRTVVVLRAVLAVIGKWLIGVLIGKIIKAALDLDDVFEQADTLYDVVLLNAWGFHTIVTVAAIEIVLNVIVAACVASMGSAWAIKEGRRWRRQVLEAALGGTTTNRGGKSNKDFLENGGSPPPSKQQHHCNNADELLLKIQLIEDFVAFDEHSLLFNWVRLAMCLVLAFIFTWYAGVVTIVMTIFSEVANKIFERMRTKLHTSIQANQLEVNQRLVDVIKNATTVKVMGASQQEIKSLRDLEQESDLQREKDAIVKCFRDATKLIFTAIVPIIMTLIAWPIVTKAEPTEAINAATALFVTMLLLDEVHKSLINLSFVHDRKVAAEDAKQTLTEFVGDDGNPTPADSNKKINNNLNSASAVSQDEESLSNTTQDEEPDLEAGLDGMNASTINSEGKTGNSTQNNSARNKDRGSGPIPPFTRVTDRHGQTISLDDVVLRYQGRNQPVLDHYSNSFCKGRIHGLVGESGSGKSTTMKVVANLLQGDSGRVQIWDGMRIAYVSQQQTLFQRSLRENVTYGFDCDDEDNDERISDETVWKALKWAHLDEWVEQLPNKLDEVMDEKSISGGQLQRLHLAHLFLNTTADCILLDECLSALDETCRESLIDRLQIYLRGKTTLLITHHSEMLRICDQIHDLSPLRSPPPPSSTSH